MGSWVRAPAGSQGYQNRDPQNTNLPEINQLENEVPGDLGIKMIKHRQNTAKFSMPHLVINYGSGRLKNNGTKSVYILLYHHQVRHRFLTGIEVLPQDWDDVNKKVKKCKKGYANDNLMIDNQKSKLTELLVNAKLSGQGLDIEKLKASYDKPEYVFDFIEFMDKSIDARKGLIADSTIRQHKAILSKLKEYKSFIRSDFMTKEFWDDYNKYLKNKIDNGVNTRHGNFKTIRVYIDKAVKKGLLQSTPLPKNPVKEQDGEVTFLTDDELRLMIDLYRKGTLSGCLQSVLRWYLFCCSTGLRISDLRAITMENIMKDLLVFVMIKTTNSTGKIVKVPLKDFAKQLIADEGEYHIDNKIFNCISEQKMRDYIKTVAKSLDITKNVNWHSSRHTFATIFLRNTNNLLALQKLLGHANIRDTMKYTHIMTEDVEAAMDFQNNY